MESISKREAEEYTALVESLEYEEVAKNASCTDKLVAIELTRVAKSSSHRKVHKVYTWPLLPDQLTRNYPLYHKSSILEDFGFESDTEQDYYENGPMSRSLVLCNTLRETVSSSSSSYLTDELAIALAKRVARALESLLSKTLEVRRAAGHPEERPSSWETVLDILPYVTNSDVVGRVHRRLCSLFDASFSSGSGSESESESESEPEPESGASAGGDNGTEAEELETELAGEAEEAAMEAAMEAVEWQKLNNLSVQ